MIARRSLRHQFNVRHRGRHVAVAIARGARQALVPPRPWLLALLGFAVAFVVVTWPLTVRFGHATYGGPGDGWALIWQTRFRLDHGISYFSPTYSTDIGWPVGGELPSSVLLSNAAVELPQMLLLWIGFGDVAAYNLITFLAALTSSLAMYVLVRRVGCRAAVAFWAGLVYLIAPWHLEKLSIHPTLGLMVAFPLLILGVVEWIRRPGVRSGALVVGAFALATYTHSYFGLAAGALLGISVVPLLVIAVRRRVVRQMLAKTALLGGVLALVPLPLGLALHAQSEAVSQLIDRPLYLIEYAARPYLWLLPSTDNPIFGDWSGRYIESHSLRGNGGELALYLGMLTISLAVVGLAASAKTGKRAEAAAVAAATALAGALLSMPGLTAFPVVGTVKMPVSYVSEVFPFVSTPTRFFVLTLTGFVLLAALGLEWIASRLRPGWAVTAIVVACVGSALELPIMRDRSVVDTAPPPIARAIKARVPVGEAVAQYPSMANFYLPVLDQLFFQLYHHRPLVNGAVAALPQDAARLAVEDETSSATPRLLALLGVRWATYEPAAAAEKVRLIGGSVTEPYEYDPPKGFRVVERLSDGSLLMRVTASPAPAIVGIAAEFTRYGRWLSDASGTLAACATASGSYMLNFKSSSFGIPRRFTIGAGSAISVPTKEVTLHTHVQLRAGWQFLRIRLLGSKPIRPSDVIPGEVDSRPLAVSIGPIAVGGPRGPHGCERSPPPDEIPTIG